MGRKSSLKRGADFVGKDIGNALDTVNVRVNLVGGHIGHIVEHVEAVNIGYVFVVEAPEDLLDHSSPPSCVAIGAEVVSAMVEGGYNEDGLFGVSACDLIYNVLDACGNLFIRPGEHVYSKLKGGNIPIPLLALGGNILRHLWLESTAARHAEIARVHIEVMGKERHPGVRLVNGVGAVGY